MTEPTKKVRRTNEEIKADLQAKIKALDQKQELADKQALLKLADAALALSKRRPSQPTIAQAATLLSQAAAAIKEPIPQ